MNRRKFLPFLGMSTAIALISPKIFFESKNLKELKIYADVNPYGFLNNKSENLYIKLYETKQFGFELKIVETDYDGYVKFKTKRSTKCCWEVKGNSVFNSKDIAFTRCEKGKHIITHFGISDDNDNLLYSGKISNNIELSKGCRPMFRRNNLILSEI